MSPRNLELDENAEEMAAALSIGNDMSPSRIRGKSDEIQQKINEGVDFSMKYQNEKEGGGPTT